MGYLPIPGTQDIGPLMLLQRFVSSGDHKHMKATNISTALSASTVDGVDATFGEGAFYSFFTPLNSTGRDSTAAPQPPFMCEGTHARI